MSILQGLLNQCKSNHKTEHNPTTYQDSAETGHIVSAVPLLFFVLFAQLVSICNLSYSSCNYKSNRFQDMNPLDIFLSDRLLSF